MSLITKLSNNTQHVIDRDTLSEYAVTTGTKIQGEYHRDQDIADLIFTSYDEAVKQFNDLTLTKENQFKSIEYWPENPALSENNEVLHVSILLDDSKDHPDETI